MIDTPEARFAIEAVREGAKLTRKVQQEMVSPAMVKGDKSPVTVADFSAQAMVGKRLLETFPHIALVGEEDASDLKTEAGRETLDQVMHFVRSRAPEATEAQVCDWIDHGNGEPTGEFWTLDPVDGTKGFLRGEQYCIALALIRDGEVVLGVLGCPELAEGCRPDQGGAGSLLIAARGQGAFMTTIEKPAGGDKWTRLAVSRVSDVADARIFRSVESTHTNTGQLGELIAAMGAGGEPIPMDSQAKYAALACGGGDMIVRLLSVHQLDYREKIWDQAAGSIVVEEAGGKVTDLDGNPLDFGHGKALLKNRGVLVTNAHLHEAALAALIEIEA